MGSVRSAWNMQCPRCGRDDQLAVGVLTWAVLYEDGTDCVAGDQEWDDKSPAGCNGCHWAGCVKDAKKAYAVATKAAAKAMDRDVDDVEMTGAYDKYRDATVTTLRMRLAQKQTMMRNSGGAAITLAEIIDGLRIALAIIPLLKRLRIKKRKKPDAQRRTAGRARA